MEKTARCSAGDVKLRNVTTAHTLYVNPPFDDSSTVGFRLFHLPHFRLVSLRVAHVMNFVLSLGNFKEILSSSKPTINALILHTFLRYILLWAGIAQSV
jgi:hypothetical protein